MKQLLLWVVLCLIMGRFVPWVVLSLGRFELGSFQAWAVLYVHHIMYLRKYKTYWKTCQLRAAPETRGRDIVRTMRRYESSKC
jgi:hypothetical protein